MTQLTCDKCHQVHTEDGNPFTYVRRCEERGTAVWLCGKCINAYNTWRSIYSPINPDIEGFLGRRF